MRILAVIPARGGSKGIPRKNIKLMNGKPLIHYSIFNANKCDAITDVVVTSDSQEIREIAALYGAETIKRSASLSNDSATLDPVVNDAVVQMEGIKGYEYDVVITLQPTSPLLSFITLDRAIQEFVQGEADTMISAHNNPHLAWGKKDSGYYPLYKERINRQFLPEYLVETGAFFITKRGCVKKNSRMGDKVTVYNVPAIESTDIDTIQDWITCESILKRKKIVIRADGHKKIGMGHIYRSITLAQSLLEHDVTIVTDKKHTLGYKKLSDSNLKIYGIEDEQHFFEYVSDIKADVVVVDMLDTSMEYMQKLKATCQRLVSIEDIGEGAKCADAVINALYDDDMLNTNCFYGEKYFCLREEFYLRDPIKINDNVKNVLVMFGGTDPSNLNEKVYDFARKYVQDNDVSFTFVTGLPFDNKEHNMPMENRIKILSDVSNVSEYMSKADMAITSQGRTVFELASMGIPSIVLAQNKREMKHRFAELENGFVNIGLGKDVSEEIFEAAFELVVKSKAIREQMSKRMLEFDLKKGIDRVKRIIIKDI